MSNVEGGPNEQGMKELKLEGKAPGEASEMGP